jgi:5-deoxy-glucuronate isomerase
MGMAELLVKPASGAVVHDITPQSAGWGHVGFGLHDLAAGGVINGNGDGNELCIVLLSGAVSVSAGDVDFGHTQGRESVFDGVPAHAFYVPMQTNWKVEATTASEVAICRAPGIDGVHPPRHITPDSMSLETRGSGANTRHVCNILPETEPADSLLVVEVITPSGNWSSYPPHKHDTDDLPHESYLEETYYHRVNPSQGYVMHRVYNDDRSLDESMAAYDRFVVLVPQGYHPVGVPHGYESYYLNVMAGPKRIWKFRNDPAHDWIMNWKG